MAVLGSSREAALAMQGASGAEAHHGRLLRARRSGLSLQSHRGDEPREKSGIR